MKTKMKFAVCAVMCAMLACSAASADGGMQAQGDRGGASAQTQQNGMRQDKKNGGDPMNQPQGQPGNMQNDNQQAPQGQPNGGMQGNNQQGQPNGDMQNNSQQAPQGQPNGNAQNGQNGGMMQKPDDQKGMPARMDLKKLLEDGVIDEDTYNAIESYLKENAPEKPESDADSAQDGQQPPEKPEGDADSAQDGQQPPEKPESDADNAQDGQQPPEKPEGDTDNAQEMPEDLGGGLDEVQLKNLLDAGIITQEQYDTLLNLLTGSTDSADAA